MNRITILCLALVMPLSIMSQELPLDFEVAEDDNWSAFNGATVGVVIDPTDAGNQVLELASNGVDFDGAALNMGTYIDLSDDNNNTITFFVSSKDFKYTQLITQFKWSVDTATLSMVYKKRSKIDTSPVS